jgi:P27 family predicted phage terminase small subunit
MAKRGRKPKPTKLKLVEGNPGKRAISDKEPQPASVASPPSWVIDDQVALTEWQRLAPELESLGLLTNLDQLVFGMYCDAVSRFRLARDAVQKIGPLVKAKKGGAVYQSPYLPVMRRERDALLKLAALMGLSPSDRTRIEVDTDMGAADEAVARRLMDY